MWDYGLKSNCFNEKTINQVDVRNRTRKNLFRLSISADLFKKQEYLTRILDRNFEVKYVGPINQSFINCYAHGSQINKRVGVGYYANIQITLQQHNIFSSSELMVFRTEVFSILEAAKILWPDKIPNQNVAVLIDSPAAIHTISNSTVKSDTVLVRIKNLHKFGKNNHIIA